MMFGGFVAAADRRYRRVADEKPGAVPATAAATP
jgi:hypothetical protein